MPGTDIVAYTIGTKRLCPCCAARSVGDTGTGNPHAYIEMAGLDAGFDVYDESSFDSSQWPTPIYVDEVEDGVDQCVDCGDWLNWFGSYRREKLR